MKSTATAAFYHNEKDFRYPLDGERWSTCGLDIYVRPDLVGEKFWAVVMFTQKDDEETSISEYIHRLCMMAYLMYFLNQDMDGVFPTSIIFLENYQPTQENRYGRMEQVRFRTHRVDLHQRACYFSNPNWRSTRPGVVEKLMGRTWEEMYLPEIKRYVS